MEILQDQNTTILIGLHLLNISSQELKRAVSSIMYCVGSLNLNWNPFIQNLFDLLQDLSPI